MALLTGAGNPILVRRRVGHEVVEVVLSELARDQGKEVHQAEVATAAAGGVLRDGQREHAVDIDVGGTRQVEPEPRASCWGWASLDDAAKGVAQCRGGGVGIGTDDTDVG